MFEYQPQRHPLQTFQFWFLIMVCMAGVGAWQLGMFPISGSNSEETQLADSEPMPPPPSRARDELVREATSDVGELPFAPLQNEEEPTSPVASREISFPRQEEAQSSFPAIAPAVPDETSSQIIPLSSESVAFSPKRLSDVPQSEPAELKLGQSTLLKDISEHTSQLEEIESEQSAIELPNVESTPLDFTEVDALTQSGDDVAALRQLSVWYWERPEDRSQFQDRLDVLARRIYFQNHPHYMPPYSVNFGDRFETIAKDYHVPWEYLSKINRTSPEKLRAGQKLKVIRGPFGVVVDLSDMELTVHAHGYYVVRMPIGIGKDESTPIGTFQVTDKVVDPIYYGPESVVAAEDPSNPLGEYWIAFSDNDETIQGFGLHGTIDPSSIGKAESQGCVRLHNQDIEDLYHLLSIGSEVVIRH